MPSPRLISKPDPIPASAFAGMPHESLVKLCAETAASNPRFSHAIAKMGSASLAFTAPSSRYGAEHSAFFVALKAGHLGYARLLAARLHNEARVKKTSAAAVVERNHHHHFQSMHNHMLTTVLSSALGDDKVLRARGWLWKRFGGASAKEASQLAFEARTAFSYGRPGAALDICAELLNHEPNSLAQATSGNRDLPPSAESLRVPLRADGRIDHAAFRSDLEQHSHFKHHREEAESASSAAFDAAALLGLGSFWAERIQAAAQASANKELANLARKIDLAMDKLWRKGACSAPCDSAKRFALAPYVAGSPQALALARADGRETVARLAPLWRAAAEHPSAPCGDSILWDAFVSAHEGVSSVGPNPFALLPSGQAAALWSLAGDASLIKLGLDRGFSPKPIQHLLARPGSSGASARSQGASLRAAPGRHALDKSYSCQLVCPDLFIDKERGARAQRPTPGALDKPTQWMRSNLASLALFCGHANAARILTQAGCDAPDATLVTDEIGSTRDSQKLALLVSGFEDFLLCEAIADPSASAAAAGVEPATAPKKRILKA